MPPGEVALAGGFAGYFGTPATKSGISLTFDPYNFKFSSRAASLFVSFRKAAGPVLFATFPQRMPVFLRFSVIFR